jgi:hypothetical protein
MSRFTFAALASLVLAGTAAAQQVPGRDLLEFPIGLLAEPQALSSRMTGGLWNPAAAALEPTLRGTIGFAGLTTPTEQGVELSMLAGAWQVHKGMTASLSLTQASVRDLFRTTTDPQTLGGEIPYGTTLFSLGLAGIRGPVTFGAAARARTARFDAESENAFSVDVGAIADRPFRLPVRVAASTFLLSPSRSKESATYAFAADLPLVSRDSTFSLRGGYAATETEHRGHEDYVFTSARYRSIDASAGVAQNHAYGHSAQRLRLGLGLRYAGYMVAFGREDGAAGIGANYQVIVTRTIR